MTIWADALKGWASPFFVGSSDSDDLQEGKIRFDTVNGLDFSGQYKYGNRYGKFEGLLSGAPLSNKRMNDPQALHGITLLVDWWERSLNADSWEYHGGGNVEVSEGTVNAGGVGAAGRWWQGKASSPLASGVWAFEVPHPGVEKLKDVCF